MGGFCGHFIDLLLREQCALVYISGNAMTVMETLVIPECGRYKGARTFLALIDVSQFLTLLLLRRREMVAE